MWHVSLLHAHSQLSRLHFLSDQVHAARCCYAQIGKKVAKTQQLNLYSQLRIMCLPRAHVFLSIRRLVPFPSPSPPHPPIKNAINSYSRPRRPQRLMERPRSYDLSSPPTCTDAHRYRYMQPDYTAHLAGAPHCTTASGFDLLYRNLRVSVQRVSCCLDCSVFS